jgi:hypothetical protein
MKLFKHFICCFLITGALCLLTSCAKTQPILNLTDQPVTQNLTSSQVKKCIELAGSKRGWLMEESKPGLIKASIQSHGHYAKISIPYSNKGYSINYESSKNLMATDGDIHRNYNKWIRELDKEIQNNLRKENEKVILKQ